MRAAESNGTLAITVADVEPRVFAEVRALRDWLSDRGVDRVTYAVVPAPDLHPLGTRAPMLVAWLRARVARGDAVAQCGLHPRRGGEFARLGPEECRGRVRAGRTLLREVELDPRGFIAPGYAYSAALRAELRDSFSWYAERDRIVAPEGELRARALRFGAASEGMGGRLRRGWDARRAPDGELLRLDLAPGLIRNGPAAAGLERLLAACGARRLITYDELWCGTEPELLAPVGKPAQFA